MGRCTELLTLHFSQPCLKKESPYAEIRRVRSYQGEKLSWSKGNVNLTDYWYTMVEAFIDQDMTYTCQHIDLLSDNESMWWQEQIENGRNWICLSFIKWKKGGEENEKRAKLNKDTDRHRFYRTFGNADNIYAFSAISEEKLLAELERFKENRNCFFSAYFLYGKCQPAGSEMWIIRPYQIADGGGLDKHSLCDNGWCKKTIQILRKRIQESKGKKNKKMVAYYLALGQIVNIIAQYEQEPVFKNLFYMFYPPIALFLEQLEKAENEVNAIGNKIKEDFVEGKDVKKQTAQNYERIKKIEISISEFIDSMEILLHHMGHSCRDILSDAGRGGIPYDIPMHLCLMYTAYLHTLTSIMNDKEYQFEYCLVPLTYSRPVTRYFDFGLLPAGRLIKVQISRHMMFMPRSLLIILAHEVSHYVSERPRCRELRAECYIEIANIAVVMQLIPESFLQDMENIDEEQCRLLEPYLNSLRRRILNYLRGHVRQRWDEKYQGAYRYHFGEFLEDIEQVYRETLEDGEELLDRNIEFVDAQMIEELRNDSKGLFPHILYIQETLKHKKVLLWNNLTFWNFLCEMSTNLRECYADILGALVLDISWGEFIETYVMSESYVPEEKSLAPALVNRFAMVKYLMEEDGRDGWVNCSVEGLEENEVNSFLKELEQQVNEYLDDYRGKETATAAYDSGGEESANDEDSSEQTDLFYYKGIIEIELKYLQQCYSELKAEILESEDPARKEQINLIQNLYKHFLVKERGQDSTYAEFFRDYDKLVEFYKTEVNEYYESKLELYE